MDEHQTAAAMQDDIARSSYYHIHISTPQVDLVLDRSLSYLTGPASYRRPDVPVTAVIMAGKRSVNPIQVSRLHSCKCTHC